MIPTRSANLFIGVSLTTKLATACCGGSDAARESKRRPHLSGGKSLRSTMEDSGSWLIWQASVKDVEGRSWRS